MPRIPTLEKSKGFGTLKKVFFGRLHGHEKDKKYYKYFKIRKGITIPQYPIRNPLNAFLNVGGYKTHFRFIYLCKPNIKEQHPIGLYYYTT